MVPFSWGNAVLGLSLVSAVCAFILLLLFKKISDQEKIKYHKDKIVGYILEIGLFRDQFGKTLTNQVRIFYHNLIYLRYVATPFLLMMVPVILICMQLENYLGYQPFSEGGQFICKVSLDMDTSENIEGDLERVSIETSPGINLETRPLRIVEEGTLYFRAKITDDQKNQYVTVRLDGTKDAVHKEIVVLNDRKSFSPEKCKAGNLNYFLCTGEEPISSDSGFLSVAINYSKAYYPLLLWEFSPIIYFFILSLVFGLVIKPIIKVNI